MKIAPALAASIVLALSSSAHANLVQSGNFAGCSGATIPTDTATCPGWTVTPASSGSVFGYNDFVTPVPFTSYAGFGAVDNIDDELSQVLMTTPGQTYTISFSLFINPNTPDTHFAADFGSTNLISFTNSGPTTATTEEFTATASAGTTTTLAFFGYNLNGVAAITNVSVVPATVSSVPLPATLPLFAGGLGALGLLHWRRKRKAQAIA